MMIGESQQYLQWCERSSHVVPEALESTTRLFRVSRSEIDRIDALDVLWESPFIGHLGALSAVEITSGTLRRPG